MLVCANTHRDHYETDRSGVEALDWEGTKSAVPRVPVRCSSRSNPFVSAGYGNVIVPANETRVAFEAFAAVLKRKQTRYAETLAWLAVEKERLCKKKWPVAA
jgi:hypothetical protein